MYKKINEKVVQENSSSLMQRCHFAARNLKNLTHMNKMCQNNSASTKLEVEFKIC